MVLDRNSQWMDIYGTWGASDFSGIIEIAVDFPKIKLFYYFCQNKNLIFRLKQPIKEI